MKVDVYNKSGNKTSNKLELNNKVFSIKPNEHSIYLAVKSELAALRQGTHSSKTRSEVRGGGAKPWKQKGTGRARVGSTRNPSRVHGGSAFGPKPRKYDLKINKKVKSLAKKSALSLKISTESYKIIDDLSLSTAKTKEFNDILKKLKFSNTKLTMIISEANKNLMLSSRNIFLVNMVSVNSLSTYDIINSDALLMDVASAEQLNNNLS